MHNIPDKGLISKVCKVFTQFINKKPKISSINGERKFQKEDMKMVNVYREKCLLSLIIKQMHIETIKYHFISVRIAYIKHLKQAMLVKM